MADQLLGGIVINEILVDPNSAGGLNFDTDGNGTAAAVDEYIELYNTSASAIDISGLQFWDAGVGNWFTFPPGTILEPGAHAMVMSGVQAGGSLPTGGPDDLFFDAGRGSALINNGGDNVIVYDPANDEYIQATFNGDAQDDPTTGAGGYAGFSPTATRVGLGEDFGFDTDGQSLQRTSDGTDTFTSDTPTPGTTNICFANGTRLLTPKGERPVEKLKVGDWVMTADHGAQKVIWIYGRERRAAEMKAAPMLAPVRFLKGALGPDLPRRTLRVSRQHRMMVSGEIARRMFGQDEVLVAAHHLLMLPGVAIDTRPHPVTYYHVLLETHEILLANGVRSESMYPGAEALRSLPDLALREVEFHLNRSFADLRDAPPPPARTFATGHQAQRLVRRLRKHKKPVDAFAMGKASLALT
ncbi:MAG TPA: hypothetical protein ENK28_06715 [Aliiroseovarius sp.]|nr:hypothetical protein [Aliiroseovarius sp.]